jgi:hypothetical protein
VAYVDHEPGRLAHLDAERWRLDGSRATRMTEPGTPVPVMAGSGQEADSGPVVVIEVGGRLPDGAAELPGVLSVRRDGEAQVVRVQAADADDVLRGLLAGGNEVRIVRVDRERAGSEGAS